jgi:hypothetical protein
MDVKLCLPFLGWNIAWIAGMFKNEAWTGAVEFKREEVTRE